MIARFKWATQRVTMILVVLLVLAIPFVLAKLGQLLGIWVAIDNLYPEQLGMYVVLMAVSRAIFGFAWGALSYFLIAQGHRSGWFWFKPKQDSYRRKPEPGVDQSETIALVLVVIACAVVLSEVAIRISTLTIGPWLP